MERKLVDEFCHSALGWDSDKCNTLLVADE